MSVGQIRVIVGLGNPGPSFTNTRHNIGFRVVDAYLQELQGSWRTTPTLAVAEVSTERGMLFLVKPLTFMNCSGDIVPFLKKKGIEPAQMLVVHDELELAFSKIALKWGGSARGHNGLRSLIAAWGTSDFWRLRFGIGRPENKEDVGSFVLTPFTESAVQLTAAIEVAVAQLKQKIAQ